MQDTCNCMVWGTMSCFTTVLHIFPPKIQPSNQRGMSGVFYKVSFTGREIYKLDINAKLCQQNNQNLFLWLCLWSGTLLRMISGLYNYFWSFWKIRSQNCNKIELTFHFWEDIPVTYMFQLVPSRNCMCFNEMCIGLVNPNWRKLKFMASFKEL
jgi:hypothetical protein